MRDYSNSQQLQEKYRDLQTGRFNFGCPVPDCEYEGKTFEQIQGHLRGKAPYDEHHEAVGPVKKWMFLR